MLELNYPPSGSARDCTEPLYCSTPSHVLTDLSALSILSSTASFSTFIVYVLTFFFLFASRHGIKAASVFLSLLVIAVYLTRS